MEPDYGSNSKTFRVNKTDMNQFQAMILYKSSKYPVKQNLSSPYDFCKLIWQQATKCTFRLRVWVQISQYCLI